METTRVKYTINPVTGQKIKVEILIWKQLAAKYYIIDGAFTDQVISESLALKVKDNKAGKERKARKRVVDPAGVKRCIIVGSKAWNERYLEYKWNGHEFGEKRKPSLPKFMNTMEKKGEIARCNKFLALFDRKVAEGRLSDVIHSSLEYALT